MSKPDARAARAHSRISGSPMSARRIVAVDGLAERDAETLALEAAGAIERRLAGDITLDRGVVERAEGRRAWCRRIRKSALRRDARTTATPVRKDTVVPEQLVQLLHAARRRAGFAEDAFLLNGVQEHGGLVGSDDPGVRIQRGDRPSLGARQPGHQIRAPTLRLCGVSSTPGATQRNEAQTRASSSRR